MDDDTLIAQYIVPDPHKPQVEEARVNEHGVSVWAIIGHLDGEGGDIARTAHDYGISAEAVKAARAYYRRHKCAIDTRLAANVA